jgi:hypothetical protein
LSKVENVGSMLKVNDGGEQECPVARPFVVVLLCSVGVVVVVMNVKVMVVGR